jgi:hypothetical protein
VKAHKDVDEERGGLFSQIQNFGQLATTSVPGSPVPVSVPKEIFDGRDVPHLAIDLDHIDRYRLSYERPGTQLTDPVTFTFTGRHLIPEPSTFLLLVSGLAMLPMFRKRV